MAHGTIKLERYKMFVSKKSYDELRKKSVASLEAMKEKVVKLEDRVRTLDGLPDKILESSIKAIKQEYRLRQENERLKTAIDLMIKAINEEKK